MKKYRKLKALMAVLSVIVLVMLTLNVIPPKKNVENNPFVVEKGEMPLIAAHRGGAINNPENTMLAFRSAVGVSEADIIESDLYLTKDGYLVLNHDPYIDETCNVNGDITLEEVKILCENVKKRHYIADMTLSELKQYNFGYYFKDTKGERIYKEPIAGLDVIGLYISTVEELFEEFYESHPDLLFILEIKNAGEMGYKACELLNKALAKYPEYKDQVVVGTFHNEIEAELKSKYPEILRGASTGSAAKFVITQLLGVNLFEKSDFACLQIPTSYDLGVTLNLKNASIIRRAQKRNIAVQYWTINKSSEMRELIKLGCDCIMTDNPVLLRRIINSYQEEYAQ